MAQADERDNKPRVVLVTNHADAAIMPKLRAELERLGLEVVLTDHGENEVVPRDLTRAAHDHRAVAGFRVLVSKGTVEVWIADRVTGKVMLREVLARDGESSVSESLVVTRSVELLRASLMELEAPYPALGDVPAPPALSKLAVYPRSPARVLIQVGAGAFVSPSSGKHTLWQGMAHLGARYAPIAPLSVGVDVRWPLSNVEIDANAGKAMVRARWLGVDVRGEVSPDSKYIHTNMGAGVALIDARVEGVASPGYEAHTLHTLSPTPYLATSTSFELAPTVRIGVDLSAGYSTAALKFSEDGNRLGQVGPWITSGIARLDLVVR